MTPGAWQTPPSQVFWSSPGATPGFSHASARRSAPTILKLLMFFFAWGGWGETRVAPHWRRRRGGVEGERPTVPQVAIVFFPVGGGGGDASRPPLEAPQAPDRASWRRKGKRRASRSEGAHL